MRFQNSSIVRYRCFCAASFFRDRLRLLETFTNAAPWTGNASQVIRRNRDGSSTPIATGLNVPIGLAEWRGDLYVSQNSYFQGPVEGNGGDRQDPLPRAALTRAVVRGHRYFNPSTR